MALIARWLFSCHHGFDISFNFAGGHNVEFFNQNLGDVW
jgi:hypothetical protein